MQLSVPEVGSVVSMENSRTKIEPIGVCNVARMLSRYNVNDIPEMFTLRGNGTICHMNTLVQALMSCSSFNKRLQNLRERGDTNPLIKAYVDLYERHSGEHLISIPQAREDNTTDILQCIVKARIGRKNIISIGMQEDFNEGFVFFLEALNDKADPLFHVRVRTEIRCTKCKEHHFLEQEEQPEIMIDLSEYNPNIQAELTTKKDIEDYIHCNVQVTPDFKCEKCGVINVYHADTKLTEPNVLQYYSLRRLSEIIVLLFKKYKSKGQRYFPPCLDFNTGNKALHYRIVAQIEHSGTMFGGHYYGKFLRPKPKWMYERRRLNAQRILMNNQASLRGGRMTSEAQREKLLEINTKMEKILAETSEDQAGDEGVFQISDGNAKFCSEGFVPTPNTYMVFYHLSPTPDLKS
jgi:ubiquitin C-terminal hydrolase